jgi:flavin-dependent thymidylate synthase
MEVKLAGFNVDAENIKLLKEVLAADNGGSEDGNSENKLLELKALEWTPETISASYARISRDPRPINELRAEAVREIQKARKSNESIIFTMGHSSVAEHAVFNIDIIGISRLLAEKLEKSRLVSFTEKSQRYIKIGNDNYLPEEFGSDQEFLSSYKDITNELFDAYNTIHDAILPYFTERHKDIRPDDKEYKDIVNLAKEDARYILPLTTLTQVGMTVNGRSLEKIIRRLLSEKLAEAKELGKSIFSAVDGCAPSLVKYTTPTLYEIDTYKNIKNAIGNEQADYSLREVTLADYDADIEEKILAAFVVRSSCIDYKNARLNVRKWTEEKKLLVFREIAKNLNFFDALLREFELSSFEFNLLVSASAYAQLKRHRMATLIEGEYSPSLDIKIPPSIIEAGLKDFFAEKADKANKLFYDAKEKWNDAAYYVLLNAHRKNVILKCNFRELVHIARLRSDKHAQWDIRNISDTIIEEVKERLPLIGSFLCAKDNFSETMEKCFS